MLWIRIRMFMDLPDSDQHYLYKKKSWKLGSGSRSGSGWKVGYKSRTASASKKRIPIQIQIRIRVINLIRIRIKVRWIHNTVQNRAGFESNYESASSFFCRCGSRSWSYVIGFFLIFHSWIYLVHKVLSHFKKNPTSCMFGLHVLTFFSPRNRA
jgi:hypothetical protein